MAKKRTVQALVLCTKLEDGSFKPFDLQPDAPITDVNKMVAWAKSALADDPGTYYFIRSVPGSLVISVHQMLNFKFE